MVEVLKTHYHLLMPYKDADLPPGVDQHRGVPCHCGVGTMHQVLSACGAAVDEELPWMRAWLLSYQFPDGGLNCFGEAYTGSRKSSIVSAPPALEAILLGTQRPFTGAEQAFLDDGARYLLNHRLFKSFSGKMINEDWLKPCFPRFYEYDVLRGLTFLARWAKLRNKDLPSAPFPRPSRQSSAPAGKAKSSSAVWLMEECTLRTAGRTSVGKAGRPRFSPS